MGCVRAAAASWAGGQQSSRSPLAGEALSSRLAAKGSKNKIPARSTEVLCVWRVRMSVMTRKPRACRRALSLVSLWVLACGPRAAPGRGDKTMSMDPCTVLLSVLCCHTRGFLLELVWRSTAEPCACITNGQSRGDGDAASLAKAAGFLHGAGGLGPGCPPPGHGGHKGCRNRGHFPRCAAGLAVA